MTKEDVKEIVEGTFGKLDAELKHVNVTLAEFKADMKARFDSLPCDRLDGEVKELSVRFHMREVEFEKTAKERKDMIDGAWSFARTVKEDSFSKEAGKAVEKKIEKLEEKANDTKDKWEARLYGLLLLALTLYLRYGG